MYNASYSQAKFGLDAREPLHKPKGKSCGYYMRLVFFFSSLIQSLIIVSLVLFLIYGQPEKSAEERRVEELELNFNRLSDNNIQLRKEKADLGAALDACKGEKGALEKALDTLKTDSNKTESMLKLKIVACERMSATTLSMFTRRPTPPIAPPVVVTTSGEMKTLKSLNAQQTAMISLIEANFTRTVQYLSSERDNALKERDTHHQDAITLRRENSLLKEQLTTYTRKCKEDFANSLDGIKTVTKDFLNRINNLFPHQLTFHLTCESQHEQVEKIRNSCTNLSRDVENKFQLYLDRVGDKVAEIQALSSRLEVLNSRFNSDLQQCEKKRSETIAESTMQLQLRQRTHDDQVEKLLMEQNRLREQKKTADEMLQTMQRMIPNPLPAVPKAAGLQAKTPSIGAPGISKTPTVR